MVDHDDESTCRLCKQTYGSQDQARTIVIHMIKIQRRSLITLQTLHDTFLGMNVKAITWHVEVSWTAGLPSRSSAGSDAVEGNFNSVQHVFLHPAWKFCGIQARRFGERFGRT